MARPLHNLLTDVAGLKVGNADDAQTEIRRDGRALRGADHRFRPRHGRRARNPRDRPALAGTDGRARSTRWCLSGGSAFGLDAASGVVAALAAVGRGLPRRRDARAARARPPSSSICSTAATRNGAQTRPIAASAARRSMPPRWISRSAPPAPAPARRPPISRADLAPPRPGWLTAPPSRPSSPSTPVGQATIGDRPHFWAAPFEVDGEFGGRGFPSPLPADAVALRHKLQVGRSEHHHRRHRHRRDPDQGGRQSGSPSSRMTASPGPSGRPTRRSTATSSSPCRPAASRSIRAGLDLIEIGAAAASCMARAIARGVYEATPADGDLLPTWRTKFG